MNQPTTVRFLSQNRPGPRMGMGHYERLLLQSLLRAASPTEWEFGIIFEGRARGLKLDPAAIQPGLRRARFSGISASRTNKWPWALVRQFATLTSGVPQPGLYHSLALGVPAPRNAPALYTIHDLPPARFGDEGEVPRWARAAMREAWGVITPSEWARGELIELLGLPPEKVHSVPYGCEHDRFHPGVEPADAGTLARLGITGPYLAYAGGFTRRKNVAAMLEAWKRVAAEFPGISLALLGPQGPLTELAAAAGAPRVVVAGYLDRDEMPRVLKGALALVCPSSYEGFGLPPLEAMALGVPVLGVNATAVPEVTAGNALLASSPEAGSLAEILQAFLRDPAAAAGRVAGGLRRAQDFSWEKHATRILELYTQALASRA